MMDDQRAPTDAEIQAGSLSPDEGCAAPAPSDRAPADDAPSVEQLVDAVKRAVIGNWLVTAEIDEKSGALRYKFLHVVGEESLRAAIDAAMQPADASQERD
jgi:hypothetical protein